MVKSIIRRIIVGVGIVLVLSMLKGTLIADVNAENIAFVPNDIVVVTTGSNTSYSVTTNTWNNETVYAFPSTVPTDWSGNDGTIYFRYSQFNGANYCSGTSNNGSISGRIYNGNRNIAGQVRLEDRVNNSYYNCNTTLNGSMASFTCNNINLSHSLNILISGANGGRYGISRLLDINCTMTNEGLANAIGGSTNTIINNNNSNTNSIINNDNQNTQSIINNNNQNTQQQIESQKVCKVIDKNSGSISDSALSSNGSIVSNASGWVITKYFNITNATIEKITTYPGISSSCWYNENKDLISCFTNGDTLVGNITIPTNAIYIRFSINTSQNKPTYKICKNGNQSIVDSTNELNDTLSDNDVSDNTNSTINGLLGSKTEQETFGPVADLLLLPLTLFRALYNGFNNSCSPFNLGTLFNTQLILPCINLSNILGSNLYTILDVAISLFMIYNIILMCINIYDKITSFKDPFNELYKPGGGK